MGAQVRKKKWSQGIAFPIAKNLKREGTNECDKTVNSRPVFYSCPLFSHSHHEDFELKKERHLFMVFIE